MANNQESTFKYLSYVTVREAVSKTWWNIIGWVVISAAAMGFFALADMGADASRGFWSEIPTPLLAALGIAAFTWMVRGEALSLEFPKSIRGWLLLNLAISGFMLALNTLPSWALIPLYLAIPAFFNCLDELSALGKKNYERLHGEGSN